MPKVIGWVCTPALMRSCKPSTLAMLVAKTVLTLSGECVHECTLQSAGLPVAVQLDAPVARKLQRVAPVLINILKADGEAKPDATGIFPGCRVARRVAAVTVAERLDAMLQGRDA
ncbi:MAG: hypothetical protein K0S42_3 [Microvirga sp.]|nr:hypothetical protein [Microvirga sp.]